MDNQSVGHSHSGVPAGKERGRHCSLQPDGGAPGRTDGRVHCVSLSIESSRTGRELSPVARSQDTGYPWASVTGSGSLGASREVLLAQLGAGYMSARG